MSEPTHIAGRLEIPVDADLSDFDTRLRTRVEAIANSIKAKIGVEWDDTDTLKSRLEAAVTTAAKGVSAKVKATVDVDKKQVEAAATTAAANVTKVLDKKGAEVKVEADDRASRQAAGIVTRLKAWAGRQRVEIPITHGAPNGPPGGRGLNPYGPLGAAFRAPMLLGLLSLIQPAIALIVQSLGGLVAMAGSAGASLYTLAAAAPLITTLGAAFATGMIAFSGWGDEGEHATKSMKRLMVEVKGLSGEWKRLTATVRESTWRWVDGEIEPLAKSTLPLLESGLAGIGRELGLLMRDGLRAMDTSRFRSDLTDLLNIGKNMTRDLGRGLGGLLQWFIDLSVASGPFAENMARGFREFGEWTSTLLDGRAERARFRDWLEYAGEQARQLGRILKNTWDALAGVFRGGREAGDKLMDSLEDVTRKWADWTNSLEGQNRLQQWFLVAEEGTRAVGRLISGLGGALARIAEDETLAGLVEKITRELLPSLENFIDTLGRELGPAVVDLISNILEVLSQLSSAGSPLAAIVDGFNAFLDVVIQILDVVPGLSTALGLILGAMVAMRPAKFIVESVRDAFGGLSKVTGGNAFAGLAGLVAILAGVSSHADGAGGMVSNMSLALGGMLLLAPQIRTFGDTVRRAMDFAKMRDGLRAIEGSYAGIDLATGAIIRTGDEAERASRRFGGLRGAMSGLKGAAGGLVSVLGGGWGIAFGAAVTLLAGVYEGHRKNKAIIDEHTEAILRNAGAVGEQNRLIAAQELAADGAIEIAQKMKIAQTDLMQAAMGDADALERVREARDNYIAGFDPWSVQYDRAIADAEVLNGSLFDQSDQLSKAQEQAKRDADAKQLLADAYGETAEGAEHAAKGTEEYARQQKLAQGAADNLRDALTKLVDKMREQREMNMSAREAIREQRDGYQRAKDEIVALTEELGNLDSAFTKNRDGFDTTTEAGRRLEGMLDDVADDTWRAMEAAKEAGASQEELNAIWDEGQGNLSKLAEQIGLSPEGLARLREETGMTETEFEIFLKTLEKTPEEVKTKVKAEGADEAKSKIEGLTKAANDNPTEVTTTAKVEGVGAARGAWDGLRELVGRLPKTHETKVSAPGAKQADEDVRFLSGTFKNLPKSKSTDVSAPGTTNATTLVANLHERFRNLPGSKSTNVSAPGTSLATSLIQTLINTAGRIPGFKTTTVNALTGSAWSGLQSIINQLWRIQSKTVTVTTNYRTNGRLAQSMVANGAIFNADGNVIRGMPFWERSMQTRLAGGFRNIENRIAQIAPAGTWRVWAEDETGGEAYIPLAASKRRRSTSILREVASRFGMALVPMASQLHFGNGGFTLPAVGSSAPGYQPVGGGQDRGASVVFQPGSITVTNPAPEPVGKTVASIARSFTLDGIFAGDD